MSGYEIKHALQAEFVGHYKKADRSGVAAIARSDLAEIRDIISDPAGVSADASGRDRASGGLHAGKPLKRRGGDVVIIADA